MRPAVGFSVRIEVEQQTAGDVFVNARGPRDVRWIVTSQHTGQVLEQVGERVLAVLDVDVRVLPHELSPEGLGEGEGRLDIQRERHRVSREFGAHSRRDRLSWLAHLGWLGRLG